MVERRVRRRRVFYIPGYDPFHARRYRELYRKEGAAQGAISGYRLEVSARQGDPGYGWHATLTAPEGRSEAEIEVLVWSDIVAASMGHSIPATYWQLVRTAWTYVGSGALLRLARLRKGPTIAALYPIAFLILQAIAAFGVGWAVAAFSGWLFGMLEAAFWPGRAFTPLFYPSIFVSLGLGAIAAVALLRWFKRHDNRVFAYYLMHDYAFTASDGGATPVALRARMAAFTDRIADALSEDWDEVLVVGHSSGAHLAVSVLADLLRAGRGPGPEGVSWGFLSLGHVVPMVSFLPKAQQLRGDLAYLSASAALTWVDVTAPGDGCTYALCDPVAVTGVAPAIQRGPLILSAAFTQTLSAERWRALRWRFFRLHFQYMCAFDRPGDYDYFRITAGPLTLADRYKDRAPSKAVLSRPASGYRDVA
jgi:NAD(P)-dependent dehydrogenase (short-subunit alcohol dehydrogenase family)